MRTIIGRLMRRMRRYPVRYAVIFSLLGVHATSATTMAMCSHTDTPRCIEISCLVTSVLSLIALLVRCGWLAMLTARAVASLPATDVSPPLEAAARRAGIRRLRCVEGAECVAFSAGLFRPRVHVTASCARLLNPSELDAVLTHEAAHVRRLDPLRRLIARAAADVLFYFPLALWWSRRQNEKSELLADQAAIDHVGPEALASALLSSARPDRNTATHSASRTGRILALGAAMSFGGMTDARVAQLLDDPLPTRRPSRNLIGFSVLGVAAAVAMSMCVGQTVLHLVTTQ